MFNCLISFRVPQALAVSFFKKILDYEYASAWYHLRKFCDNDSVLEPPTMKHMTLQPVVGTPFHHKDKEYDANVKLIFDSWFHKINAINN